MQHNIKASLVNDCLNFWSRTAAADIMLLQYEVLVWSTGTDFYFLKVGFFNPQKSEFQWLLHHQILLYAAVDFGFCKKFFKQCCLIHSQRLLNKIIAQVIQNLETLLTVDSLVFTAELCRYNRFALPHFLQFSWFCVTFRGIYSCMIAIFTYDCD